MIYGYARVSTKGQDRYGNGKEVQEKQLREAGCEEVFYDSFTGTKMHRPALDQLMNVLNEGDTVVVAKLDRIARNTRDGISIIDSIVDKGCALHILNMGMFDNSPTGKLMRTVMLAFAEFERDMIVSRTAEGKAVARQREGYREGRPKKILNNFAEYADLYSRHELTVAECCRELGISESTWHRRMRSA